MKSLYWQSMTQKTLGAALRNSARHLDTNTFGMIGVFVRSDETDV